MILYRIIVDTRYAAVGFTGKSYFWYFMRKMGQRHNPDHVEAPEGILTFRATDSDPLGDFAVGPASSFCVSEAVKEKLHKHYGEESEFIKCLIEGQPRPYYVWILNRFKMLIEPTWRPRSLVNAPEDTAWLPDRIGSVDDIVREEVLRNRWYCIDKSKSTAATFYSLVNANRWTGLKFVEEWRDSPGENNVDPNRQGNASVSDN